jgi:hypothetical protein
MAHLPHLSQKRPVRQKAGDKELKTGDRKQETGNTGGTKRFF